MCCLIKNNESSNNEKMSEVDLWLNGATVVSVAFIRCSSGNLFDLLHSATSSAFRKQTCRTRRQKGRMKMGEELLVMTENALPVNPKLFELCLFLVWQIPSLVGLSLLSKGHGRQPPTDFYFIQGKSSMIKNLNTKFTCNWNEYKNNNIIRSCPKFSLLTINLSLW